MSDFGMYVPTGMYEQMFLHVRLLVEFLGTEPAGERTYVGVDEVVGGQGRAAFELFTTDTTLKIPGFCSNICSISADL